MHDERQKIAKGDLLSLVQVVRVVWAEVNIKQVSHSPQMDLT